jgi:hypothetical protein
MSDSDNSNQAVAGMGIVCPESSVESAVVRDNSRRAQFNGTNGAGGGSGNTKTTLEPKLDGTNSNKIKPFACESTVESSLRRNLIKGALATAAAVGIGATVLGGTGMGKKLTPGSSASSLVITRDCIVIANCSLYADYCHSNNGSSWAPGLNFGGGGGEGISSNRNCADPCVYGLDFWTGNNKRMHIHNNGNVGINTSCPSYTLDVSGCLHAAGNAYVNSLSANYFIGGNAFCGIAAIFGRSPGCAPAICGATSGGPSPAIAGSSSGCCTIGVQGTASGYCAIGIRGNSSLGTGIVGDGLYGVSATGGFVGVCSTGTGGGSIGVFGRGLGAGLYGYSQAGFGLEAQTCVPIVGKFRNSALSGDRTALVQFETGPCCNLIDWNAGVAGVCNVCKIPDGSFYVGHPGSPKLVVSKGGDIGIGTKTPKTSLQVNGSLAAKVVTKTANYSMTATDFAILASGAITITLPAAKIANGMIVFVKNVSTSTVKVTPKGTDTIEGKSSSSPQLLSTQYASLTLISNGSNEWFILSNAT